MNREIIRAQLRELESSVKSLESAADHAEDPTPLMSKAIVRIEAQTIREKIEAIRTELSK